MGVTVGEAVGEGLWGMTITVTGDEVVGSALAERARQAIDKSKSKIAGTKARQWRAIEG